MFKPEFTFLSKRFPTDWEEEETDRIVLANQLSQATLSSEEMNAIDPPVVQGLFGTKLNKRRHHKHDPMTISTTYDHGRNDPLVFAIKSRQWPKEPAELQTAVEEASVTFVQQFEWLGDHVNALQWYVEL